MGHAGDNLLIFFNIVLSLPTFFLLHLLVDRGALLATSNLCGGGLHSCSLMIGLRFTMHLFPLPATLLRIMRHWLLSKPGGDVLLFFGGKLFYSRKLGLGPDPPLAGVELGSLQKSSLSPSKFIHFSPVLREPSLKQCNLAMRPQIRVIKNLLIK